MAPVQHGDAVRDYHTMQFSDATAPGFKLGQTVIDRITRRPVIIDRIDGEYASTYWYSEGRPSRQWYRLTDLDPAR